MLAAISRIWLELFDNYSLFGQHNRYICNEITNDIIHHQFKFNVSIVYAFNQV